ncbi:GNAT family N-acetyltransferase [Streptococcus sp. ZY19097]|uniref:GNAT family N-acetyltransferase n=1 Tax=Streptococcus sp. ZY19097 TaxID=3231906 RepID=UPI00345910B4
MNITISQPSPQNSQAAKVILADLPEWFGIPESTQAYVDAAGDELCLLAEAEETAIGFISLIETETAFEIDCTGVLKSYQGQGVGSAMLEKLKSYARQHAKTYLLVKTLSAVHPSSSYAQTRAFYEKVGFRPARYLEIWGSQLPCLEMVLTL